MAKGNTKAVLDRAKRHILSFYQGNGGKKQLIENGNAAGGYTDYHKGVKLAQSGDFEISYFDQRKALNKIYGKSDKNYSDDQVFKTYCHICGRAYEALAKEKPKKRRKRAITRKKQKSGTSCSFIF